MAINMADKFSISKQILPEIEFLVSSAGITMVASERLSTPRFIPFENAGRCRECKSADVDIDYVVSKDGVTLFSNRFKGCRFVPFDIVYDLPGHSFFKLKSKGFIFNVQHGDESACTKPPVRQLVDKPEAKKRNQPDDVDLNFQKEGKKAKKEEGKKKEEETVEKEVDAFFENLTPNPPLPAQENAVTQLIKEAEMKAKKDNVEKKVNAFLDNLLPNPPAPTQAEAITQLKKQADEMKAEEEAAIASITVKKEEIVTSPPKQEKKEEILPSPPKHSQL